MLLHPTDAIEREILPSGAVLFTPMELTVIPLARSEKGQAFGEDRSLAQALFTIDQCVTGRRANWRLADARLEALREFVNSLHRKSQCVAAATQTLKESGFNRVQATWLRSECARAI